MRGQNLDRGILLQPHVAGAADFAHAPYAGLLDDPTMPEHFSYHEDSLLGGDQAAPTSFLWGPRGNQGTGYSTSKFVSDPMRIHTNFEVE
jgi:hypothetical protein